MSGEASRPPLRPGRRPETEPISPEEVAAVLATVKALIEDEAAASGAPAPAKPDAWVAAGRPGPAASPRGRRPGRPETPGPAV